MRGALGFCLDWGATAGDVRAELPARVGGLRSRFPDPLSSAVSHLRSRPTTPRPQFKQTWPTSMVARPRGAVQKTAISSPRATARPFQTRRLPTNSPSVQPHTVTETTALVLLPETLPEKGHARHARALVRPSGIALLAWTCLRNPPSYATRRS